jgi:hypothetical protein
MQSNNQFTEVSEKQGRRETRGRKPLYGKPTKQISMRIDGETSEFLRGLGNGSMSAGVKKAAAIVMKMDHSLVAAFELLNKQD